MTTQPIATPRIPEPAALPGRPVRTRFGFVLAIVAQILMMAGASAPSPFYPVLAQHLGFDAIVITVVFAVYAAALLLTLLAAGSLSDHIGRRPVIVTGLVLLAGSMLLFGNAGSVLLLVLARILQGIASGLLIASLSATVLDLAPPARPGTAALWNALSPGIGLAAGALVAALALDATAEALPEVFTPLAAVYLVIAALVLIAPRPRRCFPEPGRRCASASRFPPGSAPSSGGPRPRSSPAGRPAGCSSRSERASSAASSAAPRTCGRGWPSRFWLASAPSPPSRSGTAPLARS